MAQLGSAERRSGVDSIHDSGPERLAYLVETPHQQTGQQVAVLVDEYDRPILDALEEPNVARANRDYYLQGLYAMIKCCDAHIRFCFLAGVSKFSKVSLFAGLHNLVDITLDARYSTVCGYTEADLDTVFAPELEGLNRVRVRDWYNGYNWGGPETVYNPFDTLLLFRSREFRSWWFETGTPRFLVETLVERGVPTPSLGGMLAREELLSTFDVGDIATEALLFQTGYPTVAGIETRGERRYYRLDYPNREVRQSLNESLLGVLVKDRSRLAAHSIRLYDLLQAADMAGLDKLFRSIFTSIPYQWHTRSENAHYDGYYASLFYSFVLGAGADARAEESGSIGRLDMAVQTAGRVYLFEFKVVERAGPGSALAQLRERGYADKYMHLGKPVHLVGVEFSARVRNVARFEAEPA